MTFKKKNPTRCNTVSKFYYSIFIWSSTCFGRHTAHHQAPKTALVLCAWQRPPATHPTAFHVRKTRGCQCSFRLLMMGGVSPETCWASYKYGIIKFWYIVASCWVFLYELYYDARIHKLKLMILFCCVRFFITYHQPASSNREVASCFVISVNSQHIKSP